MPIRIDLWEGSSTDRLPPPASAQHLDGHATRQATLIDPAVHQLALVEFETFRSQRGSLPGRLGAMEPSVAYELGRAGLGGLYEGLHHHPGMSMHGASPAAAGLGVAQATSSKGEGHPPGWMCPGCPRGATPRCAIGALTQ